MGKMKPLVDIPGVHLLKYDTRALSSTASAILPPSFLVELHYALLCVIFPIYFYPSKTTVGKHTTRNALTLSTLPNRNHKTYRLVARMWLVCTYRDKLTCFILWEVLHLSNETRIYDRYEREMSFKICWNHLLLFIFLCSDTNILYYSWFWGYSIWTTFLDPHPWRALILFRYFMSINIPTIPFILSCF